MKIMADINQNKAEQYRKERKERLAKAAKKNAKNIEKKTAVRSAVKKVIAIVLAAVVGLSCLGGILSYVGVLQSMAQVGYVKDEHISFAEYKYYYLMAYNNLFNTEYQAKYYGYQTGTGYDVSLSPEEQTTTTKDADGNEITWVEYFREKALEAAQMYLAYYQEAKKNGMELDKADIAEIDKNLEELRENANSYGKRDESDENNGYSLNAYLRVQYGSGINANFLKKQMEKEALVRKYSQSLIDGLKDGYSADKVKEIFEKNPDEYLFTDVRIYQFALESLTAEEGEKEDALAKRQEKSDKQAKDDANKMYSAVTDEKSFLNYAKKLNTEDKDYDADQSTLLSSYKKADSTGSGASNLSSINEDLANWAFKDSTKKNDKKLITIKQDDKVSGYIVALMVNPKHDVDTVSVRHILFKTVDDENKPLDDDKIKAAKANAEQTLAKWKAGDADEDSFADFATELTEDTGSQSTGGLYENVAPGQMVAEFNNWIFDKARKESDCDIVETSYGYHIIYFVSKDGSSKDNTIRTNLATEEFEKNSQATLDSDEYKIGAGPRRTAYVEKELLKKIAKQVANINAQSASAGY